MLKPVVIPFESSIIYELILVLPSPPLPSLYSPPFISPLFTSHSSLSSPLSSPLTPPPPLIYFLNPSTKPVPIFPTSAGNSVSINITTDLLSSLLAINRKAYVFIAAVQTGGWDEEVLVEGILEIWILGVGEIAIRRWWVGGWCGDGDW